MLRQIEWRPQNGPIAKSGVLPITTYFSGKFVPVLEPLKVLTWCTNDLNVHIRIIRKRWGLILGSFFPMIILNESPKVIWAKEDLNKPPGEINNIKMCFQKNSTA